MNIHDFITAIRTEVEETAVRGCLSQYDQPSGRKPGKSLVELSDWYRSLSESDRTKVRDVAQDAAHAAVFGFLCVLDGVRAIENNSEQGEFELWYVKGGKRILINGPGINLLHDEYNATNHEA